MWRITRKRRIDSPCSVYCQYNKSFKELPPVARESDGIRIDTSQGGEVQSSIGRNREVDNLSEALSQSRIILATSEDMSVS